MNSKQINHFGFLDLFSGIGGFHEGLLQAGIKPSFTAHSDIDKHALSVYQKHFSNSVSLGDVRTIKPIRGKINNQKIDLITFGSPCQNLSIAGNRKGLEGSQSSLFFEAIRIVEGLRPCYFIFENVKGLFSSQGGRDFKTVLQAITDIGYSCQWQLINSNWFLPQNRERIFLVGYPANRCAKPIFPIIEAEQTCTARKGDEVQQINTNTLKARDYSSWRGNFLTQLNKDQSQGFRVYDTNCSVAAEAGLYAIPVLTPDRKKRQNGRRFKDIGDSAFTLTAQDRHGIYDGLNIRRLTPLECERLQGFNDNWTQGNSDNQRYKMLGNSVSVPVVKAIINKIYN